MDIDFTEVLEKLHEEIPVPKGCKEPLKDNSKGELHSLTHKDCTLAKGLKFFKCTKCGDACSNYCNGVDVCNDCCSKYNICKICGKPLKPMIVHSPEAEYKSDTNTIRCVKVNEGCIFSIKKETLSDFIRLLNDFNIELSTLNCEDGWIDILIKNKISLNNSVWRAIG